MPRPNTLQEVLNCSFQNWYPSFKSITFKSEIIPLSKDFIEYLHSDGVYLRKESTIGKFAPKDIQSDSDDDEDDIHGNAFFRTRQSSTKADDSDDWERQSEDETDSEEQSVPTFPELEEKIEKAIKELGAVFPKLNWSSPRDASWIMPGSTLKCTTVDEVVLLLKSSDFIVHDLSYALSECSDFTPQATNTPYFLILRQWKEINRSMEFRCFVKNHKLIAVTQRDQSDCYEFLKDMKQDILENISKFFARSIEGKFLSDDFCFDVYLENSGKKIWLLDFNPFSTADTFLFNEEELHEGDFPKTQIRIIEERSNMQPSEFGIHRVPADILTIQSDEDVQKFVDLFRAGRLPNQDDSDDDDE